MMSADILQNSIKRTFETDSSNHSAIKRRENAAVFLEVGGDLVQGGEIRRSFVGLEEGDVHESLRSGQGVLGLNN
jgi:hypothetical protein